MLKYIVNTNCQIDISPFTTTNKIIITCQKGMKVGGAETYIGPMTLTLTKVSDTVGGTCAYMTITINPSAQKVKCNGNSCFLEGDKGTGSGAFVNTSGSYSLPVTATIIKAGQTKVKGM